MKNLLLATRIFILLIIVTGLLFSNQLIPPAKAALKVTSITITEPAQSPKVGSDFSIDLQINSGAPAISGISVAINYSPNVVFKSIDFANSVFPIELKPTQMGVNQLNIERVRFDTGYSGTSGQIAKLIFTANQAGPVNINIDMLKSQTIAFIDSSNTLLNIENSDFIIDNLAIALPTVSPPTKQFSEPFALSLTHPDPAVQIRYTLDGTTPDQSSALYLSPIIVNKTQKLKAIAFLTSFQKSQVISADYARIKPELSITKKVDKQTAIQGDILNYEITVTNNQQAEANNILIRDLVPPGSSFVEADNNGTVKSAHVEWTLFALPKGQSFTVKFKVMVNQ